jgi:hypothetical protein
MGRYSTSLKLSCLINKKRAYGRCTSKAYVTSRPRRPPAESHQTEKLPRRQARIARAIMLNMSCQLGEKRCRFCNDDVQVCKMPSMPQVLLAGNRQTNCQGHATHDLNMTSHFPRVSDLVTLVLRMMMHRRQIARACLCRILSHKCIRLRGCMSFDNDLSKRDDEEFAVS